MTESIHIDDQFAKTYAKIRDCIDEMARIYAQQEAGLDRDQFMEDIDALVAERVGPIVVLEETEDGTSYTPQTSAQVMRDGIFNMVVSLVLLESQSLGPEGARKQMRGFLEQLIAGLDSETQDTNPKGTT